MLKKKLLSIFIATSLLLTACGKDSISSESSGDTAPASTNPKIADPMAEMPSASLLRAEGRYAYTCVTYESDKNNAASVSKSKIFMVDDQYGLSLEYLYHEDNERKSTLCLINSSGELTDSISLKKGRFIAGYTEGKYVCYDQAMGEANILDSEGKDVSTIKPEFEAFDILVNSDGVWFYGVNDIELYSVDGTKKCDVAFDDESLNFESPIFKSGDTTYVVAEQGNIMDFYKIDIDNSAVELVWAAGTNDVGRVFSGGYIIEGNDVFKLEPAYHSLQKIADLGLSNVFPPQRSLSMGFSDGLTVFLDDDHFVVFYPYSDGSIEANFFTYNPNADFSNMKIITVGGFNLTNDEQLNYAISQFNASNDEYHIRTVEYWDLYDKGLNEYRSRSYIDTVKMFKDFAEGNAPDIFYGTEFDYDYMGKAGMVEDLAPYLNADEDFNSDSITPSIRSIMFDENGSCYKIFPSYYIKCMQGFYSVIGNDSDMSIYDVSKIAEEKKLQAFAWNNSVDMAYDILNPSLKEWWGVYGEKSITEEQLRDIVSFCLENGVSEEEYWRPESHPEVLEEDYPNTYLLMPGTVGLDVLDMDESLKSPVEKDYVTVGIPSLDGSHYTVSPRCLLAMSSSSENKDICYEFMRILMSEDVQRQCILNRLATPINQNVINNCILSYTDPDNCPDEDFVAFAQQWIEMGDGRWGVSQNKIDNSLKIINSVDRLEVYDYGLRDIIEDEFDDYWSQGKSIDEITKSLMNRLDLYVAENYQ